MSSNQAPATTHVWKFFRTGGLDQVSLETGADLLALDQLDQKLWVALSCPVKGLELDEKTLELIDADKDGRIRVPELIAAINWAAARLKDPTLLLTSSPELPLDAINDATPEGKVLVASARQILSNLGKKNAPLLPVDDAANTTKIFASSALNGDGVIPPEATEDPATQALIKEIISTVGGKPDLAGSMGVTAEQIGKFFTDLAAYVAWVEQSAVKDIAVLGSGTDAAVSAIKAVRAKVDDFFARTRLAAFDGRAIAALNREETAYLAIAAKDLTITAAEIAGFPLARIGANHPLPLLTSVNPAWAAALGALYTAAVAPVFGAEKTSLTEDEWRALNAKFAAYETWLGSKAGSEVEKLGVARAKEILAGPGRAALDALIAADTRLAPEFKAISEVERLARYVRDLRELLHNFVNFAYFYSRDRYAIFQAGTLYLDSRSCELCIRVDGVSPLAATSKAYIAYLDCKRVGGATMKIAACVTQGDSDYLFIGRNGIFYDRQGRDWDATITNIVDNPISLRQAFWSPYKKLLRMIEEQVAKRAAAADAAASSKLASAAEKTANVDQAKPAEPPKKVDVGAVAALGVAVSGAMGALTLILGYIFKLEYWQYPLVLLGLILVISAPAVIIAWLKLRQRTLGPILEGNGWAINGRVKINFPLGVALTARAALPPGSKMSLEDPYEDKGARRQRRLGYALVVVVILAIVAWNLRHTGAWTHLKTYFVSAPATPATTSTP